jgi:hypothetical protein
MGRLWGALMGRPSGSAQTPEVAREPDVAEERFGLGRGSSSPVTEMPAGEPPACELPLPVQRHGFTTRIVRREPALEMILRPEDQHVRSGVSHVLVPPRGRHSEMNDLSARGDHLPVDDLDAKCISAIGTGRRNAAVGIEKGQHAQGIPDADRVPDPFRRSNLEGRVQCREGMREPNMMRAGSEGDDIGFVKFFESVLYPVDRYVEARGHLRGHRCSAFFHEGAIDLDPYFLAAHRVNVTIPIHPW